jgi:hypothetical protein
MVITPHVSGRRENDALQAPDEPKNVMVRGWRLGQFDQWIGLIPASAAASEFA